MTASITVLLAFALLPTNVEVPASVWTTFVGTNSPEHGRRLSIDRQRHIALPGQTDGDLAGMTNGGKDAFLASICPDGTVNWTAQEGDTKTDIGHASAILPNGESYVCGFSVMENTNEAYVSGYHRHGSRRWTRYFGRGNVLSMDSDRCGHLFVTGTAGGGKGFIGKLNRCGSVLWWKEADGIANHDLTVDRDGNVVVIGKSGGVAVVTKFSTGGIRCWQTRWKSNFGGPHIGRGVTTDDCGRVFACGWVGVQADVGSFVLQLDRCGVVQRSLVHSEPGQQFTDICTSKGRAIVSGHTNGSANGRLFLLAADSELTTSRQHWLHEEDDGHGLLVGIQADQCGDIYVSGRYRGRLNGQSNGNRMDAFAAKYRLSSNTVSE